MSERASIVIFDDGPCIVAGLEKLSNSRYENLKLSGKVALCRCGASENKPFCDVSNKEIGFTDGEN